MQKRISIDIEIGSSVLFDSTDFFVKLEIYDITNFVPGDKT